MSTIVLLAALLAAPGVAAEPAAPALPVLRLDDALRIARENQPALRLARSQSSAAAARADEARAPLLPQVTGSASVQLGTSNSTRPAAVEAAAGTEERSRWSASDTWRFGASASQLVYDFGATTGRWRAAREGAAAQRESERTTLAQSLLAVRTAYFGARAARDLVAVARDTVANQEAHLRQVQGFVEVGTRPEIDLAQARADRANAQVRLIDAENGYDTARAQLVQAMGVEGPADFEVGDDALPPLDVEDAGAEPLVAEALRARPEITALERQLRADEAAVGAVRGAYLPSLGVSTAIDTTGRSIPDAVPNWTATATLTWNLFQGGLTRAQEREARANLDGADAQLAAQRQQVRLDVEQARLAVRASKASVAATGEAVANARQRLRLAEGRYQAGAGSIIELGDAQIAYTAAAAQEVQARYGLASARARLIAALGRDAGQR
jgi:outer membrane protein